MATVYWNDITEWSSVPLKWVSITIGDTHVFDELDESSTWEVKALTDDNDTGGKTIVGWQINAHIVTRQNNYDSMRALMDAAANSTPSAFSLYLSGNSTDPNPQNITIDKGAATNVHNYNINNISFNGSDAYPLLTIDVSATLSVDATNNPALPIFT